MKDWLGATSVALSAVANNDSTTTTTTTTMATTTAGAGAVIDLVLDRILLLSPRTWWGLLRLFSKNDVSPVDSTVVGQALVGTLLPIVLLWTLWNTATITKTTMHNSSTSSRRMMMLLTCLSPWTLHSIHQVVWQASMIVKTILASWKNRFHALPSAYQSLEELRKVNRVYSTRRYNVFLPPSPSSPVLPSLSSPSELDDDGNDGQEKHEQLQPSQEQQSQQPQPQKAVLFFPGMNVPHVAYSTIASRLADAGMIVVVVSMEPLRIACRHLGADRNAIQKIMRQVERGITQNNSSDDDGSVGATPPSLQWSLMGHSMGALYAMSMYPQLAATTTIHHIVLWGVAAFYFLSTDLSECNDTPILKVQCTNDAVIDMRKAWQSQFDAHFPPSTTQTEWIQGGGHDGFADYSDGMSGISQPEREEQQRIACAVTADFLKNNTNANDSGRI